MHPVPSVQALAAWGCSGRSGALSPLPYPDLQQTCAYVKGASKSTNSATTPPLSTSHLRSCHVHACSWQLEKRSVKKFESWSASEAYQGACRTGTIWSLLFRKHLSNVHYTVPSARSHIIHQPVSGVEAGWTWESFTTSRLLNSSGQVGLSPSDTASV